MVTRLANDLWCRFFFPKNLPQIFGFSGGKRSTFRKAFLARSSYPKPMRSSEVGMASTNVRSIAVFRTLQVCCPTHTSHHIVVSCDDGWFWGSELFFYFPESCKTPWIVRFLAKCRCSYPWLVKLPIYRAPQAMLSSGSRSWRTSTRLAISNQSPIYFVCFSAPPSCQTPGIFSILITHVNIHLKISLFQSHFSLYLKGKLPLWDYWLHIHSLFLCILEDFIICSIVIIITTSSGSKLTSSSFLDSTRIL